MIIVRRNTLCMQMLVPTAKTEPHSIRHVGKCVDTRTRKWSEVGSERKFLHVVLYLVSPSNTTLCSSLEKIPTYKHKAEAPRLPRRKTIWSKHLKIHYNHRLAPWASCVYTHHTSAHIHLRHGFDKSSPPSAGASDPMMVKRMKIARPDWWSDHWLCPSRRKLQQNTKLRYSLPDNFQYSRPK